MHITTLIEDDRREGRDDLTSEMGLSLLIEHDGHRIVFDTGTTGAFADNARTLGVDLREVDVAVLSHHHFDHAGGLERFFAANHCALVYLRRAEHARRYFRAFGVIKREIGVEPTLWDRFADRLIEIDEATEIAPGVTLVTDIGSEHPRPRGNDHLYVDREGKLEPDPFDHELLMVVDDRDGLVVITGCSHSGVLNMVETAARRFPDRPIKAVVGGFHLKGLPIGNTMAGSRDEVAELGRRLGERSDGPILTGHCTGHKAYDVLSDVLGDRLGRFPTGSVREL